ncbi:MAG: adenylosuccinate lyase [Bacteroides sp. SM23_62]|nr:MAG: adenylosuccinate lyase [Bacteroides sp. SM23_62]
MKLTELSAISPVDGRYRTKVKELAPFFSEFGLIRYRVFIEIEYFIELCQLHLKELSGVDPEVFEKLRIFYTEFTEADAEKIKEFEKTTNHDVKAVEYYIKEKFDETGLSQYKEFIHFALTSQDVNNTATPLSIKDAMAQAYLPLFDQLMGVLREKADQWTLVPMLGKTHGQPASPTRMGKEIKVFVERLENQSELLKTIPYSAKFGGATGNFNAHHVAYPEVDWVLFADKFLADKLGLQRQKTTTQIEHYDHMAALFDNLKRINTILVDLARDIWSYISMEYFKQKIKKGEVGSSVMPHKVNPIDFENAEGNLGLANAIFEHLSSKLPVSRLQRDLTDSTVSRNIGVPLAHTLLAFKSLLKGLDKLIINEEGIRHDLDRNWAVVTEALQTILRREGYPKPYEALKDLTRNNKNITRDVLHAFIDTLPLDRDVIDELKRITPENYTGI